MTLEQDIQRAKDSLERQKAAEKKSAAEKEAADKAAVAQRATEAKTAAANKKRAKDEALLNNMLDRRKAYVRILADAESSSRDKAAATTYLYGREGSPGLDQDIAKLAKSLNIAVEDGKVIKRPMSVPRDAVYDPDTKGWTRKDENWDESGKRVSANEERIGVKPGTQTGKKDSTGQPAVDSDFVKKGRVKTPMPGKETVAGIADRITGKETPAKNKTGKLTIDQIYAKAAEEFGAIDTIFKSNPELATLMTRAVNEKWKPARWASELQNTGWFKSNATDLQQRGFYKRQYTDLLNAIPAGAADRQAKVDALDSSTTYGRGLASIKRLIQAEAISQGAVIEDAALNTLAQNVYDNALEKDSLAIKSFVRAQIKYQPGKILSGKAGTDLADLKKTAAANGLDIDKAFGSSLQGWLQKLAGGESVETYKGIIRQAAKAGLPERVASLLDNGVDLETIYTPYKNILASTLEINPASITLDDPTLRSAIGPDKEMSIYDYQRQLRKDPRWQYTNNAREETSNAVMKVLKDFGFQG